MIQAMEQAKTELLGHTVDHLDQAVFGNSRTEGASELDVLLRLLHLRGRVVSESSMLSVMKDHSSKLTAVRTLHELTPALKVTEDESSQLAKWRRDEVYDSEEKLNQLHAPLSCGDIFETAEKSWFVLLGQPCDIAVRSDGRRVAEQAALVRITKTVKESTNLSRYFHVPAAESGGDWSIDFLKTSFVLLEFLEYCTFDSQGRLQLSVDDPVPGFLLTGWQKRYEAARTRLARELAKNVNARRKALLTLSRLPHAEGTFDEPAKSLAFRYRRVARLRSRYATAAFAGFAQFQTRPAFDHDFAKGIPDGPNGEILAVEAGTPQREALGIAQTELPRAL
jgi:hypothetical protein